MLTQGVNHPNANRAYPHALDGLDNFSVELLVNEMDVLVDDRQRVQELEGWGLLWVTSRYRWGAGGGGGGGGGCGTDAANSTTTEGEEGRTTLLASLHLAGQSPVHP